MGKRRRTNTKNTKQVDVNVTDRLDPSDVKRFVRNLHNEYENRTLLPELCDIQVYFDEQIRRDQSPLINGKEEPRFFQIGEWTEIPTDVISSGPANHIVKQIVQGIANGERNFLIDRLDSRGKDERIRHTTVNEFDYQEFSSLSNRVSTPDYLILPLKNDLHSTVSDWDDSGYYFFMSEEFVVANGEAITINWYSENENNDFEGHGYLIDSEALEITQKWHGDSDEPRGFEHHRKYDKFSKNRPLMTFFGKEVQDYEESDDFKQKIDFLYRTVLSEPKVNPDGVLQFRFSN